MPGTGTERSGPFEKIYRVVRQAVEKRCPISAVYQGRYRLFCPHRLGRNKEGQLRALCYQFGGESNSGLKQFGSSDNWRCLAIEKLSDIALLEGAWHSAPNHSRPASCITHTDIDVDDCQGGS